MLGTFGGHAMPPVSVRKSYMNKIWTKADRCLSEPTGARWTGLQRLLSVLTPKGVAKRTGGPLRGATSPLPSFFR